MGTLCGWASIDENGKAKGGSAGDQTGREVRTGNWYDFGQKVVLRFKDRNKAKKAAGTMNTLCVGNIVGYDQNQRTTLYTEMEKVGFDASKLKVKCETDCSAMMAVVLASVGIKVSKDIYTGNMVKAIMNTGEFEKLTASKYMSSGEYLLTGDISVNEGRHTIMTLEDGAKASGEEKGKTGLKTGQAGLNLIKQSEGCRLQSYKCPAGVWTIGYGHTSGVTAGQVITQAQADAFLASDVEKFEKNVNKFYEQYKWNQNEFDALVSFAFNIGSIDQLTANGTRSRAVIAEKMVQYNKAAGKVLAGLTKRRQEERKLFLSESGGTVSSGTTIGAASSVKVDAAQSKDKSLTGTYTVTASSLRLRAGAGTNKAILVEMPSGAKVKCYGYYTSVSGVKWLYVVYNGMTGFASSEYLRK